MAKNISLLPNERVVMTSDKDILALTNHRVRYNSLEIGRSEFLSITLDSVASCGLVTHSYPVLILLGIASLFLGWGGDFSDDHEVMFMLGSAVLIFAYFLTRRAVIAVASNGGEIIRVPAKGMAREACIEFLEAVEKEKVNYVKSLGVPRP